MSDIQTSAAEHFAVLSDVFAGRAQHGQMMGRPVLKTSKKLVAVLENDALGIRLGRDSAAFAEAMALPDTCIFAPGDGSRPFKDWVALPLAHADHWERFTGIVIAVLEQAVAD